MKPEDIARIAAQAQEEAMKNPDYAAAVRAHREGSLVPPGTKQVIETQIPIGLSAQLSPRVPPKTKPALIRPGEMQVGPGLLLTDPNGCRIVTASFATSDLLKKKLIQSFPDDIDGEKLETGIVMLPGKATIVTQAITIPRVVAEDLINSHGGSIFAPGDFHHATAANERDADVILARFGATLAASPAKPGRPRA